MRVGNGFQRFEHRVKVIGRIGHDRIDTQQGLSVFGTHAISKPSDRHGIVLVDKEDFCDLLAVQHDSTRSQYQGRIRFFEPT